MKSDTIIILLTLHQKVLIPMTSQKTSLKEQKQNVYYRNTNHVKKNHYDFLMLIR